MDGELENWTDGWIGEDGCGRHTLGKESLNIF